MAIVFFVTDGAGGYGDFLFALKSINMLKKRLVELGYTDKIYLVTQKTGKEKIVALGGHQEFDVDVLSLEEFNANPPTIDYFMEGPVFNPRVTTMLQIPNDVPILLAAEYALNLNAIDAKELFKNPERWKIDLVESGFSPRSNGILPSMELVKVAQRKREFNFNYKNQYWAELDAGHSARILQGKSIDEYEKNTELSFEYSHDLERSPNLYHDSSCEHYLWAHQLFTEDSTNNQDIVSIGKNTAAKKNALKALLPELKRKFNKVIYVNLDTGEEEVFHDDRNPAQKTYRLLHATQFTHREMIAMQALSGDLVGVTGDQSFSEGLSAEKIMVYECLSHKESLAQNFLATLDWYTKNKEVKELAELLLMGNIFKSNWVNTERNRLKQLLKNPLLIAEYKAACELFALNFNLIDELANKIGAVVGNDYQLDNLDLKIRNAIYTNNIEKIKDIMKQPHFSFSTTDLHGKTTLAYAIEKQRFEIVAVMINFASENKINMGNAITIKDKTNKSAFERLPKNFNQTHPDLYNFLVIERCRESYEKIISAYKPNNMKRQHQLDFLMKIKESAHTFPDKKISEQALVGALLLIRKSIRDESYFYHGSSLLKKIDAELKSLSIDPTKEKYTTPAFSALKSYVENSPDLQKNITFIHEFNKLSGLKLELDPPKSPDQLQPHQIQAYQNILAKKKTKTEALKLSRKDRELIHSGLPFSILKYPKDKGFYILDHGEGAVLGHGGWGKVKNAYYCDENGNIHSPVAIKIESNKSNNKAYKEISMFSQAHPRTESYLYKQGKLTANNKSYSVFPKFPAPSLESYLNEHPNLTLNERLNIFKSLMHELKTIHSHGIAHLDIKPKNLLYDPKNKTIYFVDFGCAENFGTKLKYKNFSQAKFDIEYRPPEYVNNKTTSNEKLDIFSCMVLLCRILNISIKKLFEEKLNQALNVFANDVVKAAIKRACSTSDDFGSTIFKLPKFCYLDPNFDDFTKKFCSINEFNFDELDKFTENKNINQEIKSLLMSLSNKDPKMRPSAIEVCDWIDNISIETESKLKLSSQQVGC